MYNIYSTFDKPNRNIKNVYEHLYRTLENIETMGKIDGLEHRSYSASHCITLTVGVVCEGDFRCAILASGDDRILHSAALNLG